MLHYFTMIRFLSLLMIWLGGVTPAWAQGVQARSDHFILLSEAPVDGQMLLTDLEQFRVAVMADLNISPDQPEPPLRLNIISDPHIFAAVSPGGITAAIYRQSAAGNDIVVGFSDDPEALLGNALDPGGLRLVLRHELVHHILEAHYPRKLPIWLGEGLAEYYATFEQLQDGQARFGRALPEQDPLSETDPWLPMRTVIESMARYPDFRTIPAPSIFRAQRLYYGQSWALAHFVMDQPDGLARIHRFVDDWHPDQDSEDSFERAFGLRYAPLEQRMRREMTQETQSLRAGQTPLPNGSDMEISELSAEQIRANRLRLLLSHGRMSERTQTQIASLRAALTDQPPSVRLADAHYQWRIKDWDASDLITSDFLQDNPDSVFAHKIRAKTAYGRVAERQLEEGLWDEAEATVLQALRVSPNDPELHLFRVAVSLPETERLPEPARASLDWLTQRQTHLRLPHTAMMMIPALIYERRFNQADLVLDTAARWTESPADSFVIDRLRANVATERAARATSGTPAFRD